jgi:hypothetical protein
MGNGNGDGRDARKLPVDGARVSAAAARLAQLVRDAFGLGGFNQ